MAEIKCPKCGEIIKLDKSEYDALLSNVEKEEILKRVQEQEKLIEEKYKAQFEKASSEEKNKKESDIASLNHRIEILEAELKNKDKESELAVSEAVTKAVSEEKEKTNIKQQRIIQLEEEIKKVEQQQKLAVAEAVQKERDASSKKDATIVELQGKITVAEQQKELVEKTLKEQYESKLKDKQEQLDYYKDLKTKMSTKLVGESLEQHCEIKFNEIRMAAYPNAYFEKDNDASGGSKGDFIFRDYDENGNEIVSIMFEMKNETDQNDTSTVKHKNEHFFKKLDDDRNKKGCEYAVLVSLLEPESELYNSGIVDVSYRYEKMYVVRPQCFLSIISLLRNGALKAVEYKNELAIIKNQNVDVTNFENKLLDFQEKFGNNYRLANERFNKAIEEIDKTIEHLQKVKDGLIGADRNLRLANDKLQDLSIKKLTHGNPTMKAMFDEVEKDKSDQ